MLGIKLLQKYPVSPVIYDVINRQFSVSITMYDIAWRLKKGYPKQWSQRGVLTDGPDYSYEDGRPTPYGTKQRARILAQQQHAAKIVAMMDAVKYAQNRYQEQLKREQEENEAILSRKLKWKGGDPHGLEEETITKDKKKFR